jgi:type I restriction enzyme S subunit
MNEVGGLSTAGLRRFKPYSKYIESGVRSIGKIPFHWQVTPLKYSSVINPDVLPEETNPDFSFKYLDISGVDSIGRIGETEMVRFENAPSRARRRVQLGDTIISTVRTYLKAIALIDETSKHLIVSTGFSVVRPSDKVDSRFLWRAVQSQYFVQLVVAYSAGISYPAISPSRLARIPIVLPAHEEEGPIVEFLDRETAKIDALIGKKERLIELLQEKCIAIITHAVTRGIDANARSTESEPAWPGQTPDGWQIKRLKFISEDGVVNGLFKKKEHYGSGTRLINVFDIYRDDFIVDQEQLERVQTDGTEAIKFAVEVGDIFFVRSSLKAEGVGKSACALELNEPTVFECHVSRVRPRKEEVNPLFLINFLNSAPTRARLVSLSNIVTMATIDQSKMGSIEVALAPYALQERIVSYIDTESTKIRALIEKVREGIDRLKEYRTALISAAVTGKIDVRDEVTSHSDS